MIIDSYSAIASGERQGSATAVALPNISGELIWISAIASNAGNVYIGGAGVTVPDGTTDITSGLQLAPGLTIGPIPIKNLSFLYMICDNAGDDITYLVVK